MRPEFLNQLFSNIGIISGIGEARAKLLGTLGIRRVIDLLFHVPGAIIMRKPLVNLLGARENDIVTLKITVNEFALPKKRGMPLTISCTDDANIPIDLVFFNMKPDWLKKSYSLGETRYISGKLEMGTRWKILHPDYVAMTAFAIPEIEPIYPLTAGLTNRSLYQVILKALPRVPDLPEWQDAALLQQRGWPSFAAALKAIHQPMMTDKDADKQNRERLAYDEILAGQLALQIVRQKEITPKGRPLPVDKELRAATLKEFPYPLTPAQQRVLNEIDTDMAAPLRMLRLLQGDVGSGKTIVAFLAMLNAIGAGMQAAIMAPTEILARQHAETIGPLAAKLGIPIALLTGRDKGAARNETLAAIADGRAKLIIGTHALFQDSVSFNNLGFITIDEQHKFGVHQRMDFTNKGKVIDTLVMTATPIPRTLTLTMYGDMASSRLDEKPPGRIPTQTSLINMARMADVISAIQRKLATGGQIYWVCPLVAENEILDVAAAEERYRDLTHIFGDKVALIHGKLKPAGKDIAMARFTRGDAKILVATTVIEVGVNVPNATVMVIEHAERFGLAQLHQLRGRVGRGSQGGTCLLIYKKPLSDNAEARLEIMRRTNDGFVIAEEDLRLRGAGELLGARQSGLPEFRLCDLDTANKFMEMAHQEAKLILERDPELQSPRGQALRTLLYLFEKDQGVRLLRGG